MAKAVVRAAAERNLEHEEVHSKVEYIVAHGIASYVGGKRVVIGAPTLYLKKKSVRSVRNISSVLTSCRCSIPIVSGS